MSRNPLETTVYVLYENDGDHQMFYDRNSRKDGYAIPCVYFREEIEKANYIFKPTFDYVGLGSCTDAAYIISFNLMNPLIFQSIAKHPKEKCFLFLIEPPIVSGNLYNRAFTNYFGKIFTMLDDYVDNINYFKFFHPLCCEKKAENIPDFSNKKLCVLIQSNHQNGHPKSMYHERRTAANFFHGNPDFDLFGNGWKGYSNWKGYLINGKMDLIKNYKFCLCYENMCDQYGYMTERLIECFYAGCVPIYLGPKNINSYVPKECFVNRLDFTSYDDLYRFMKNMNKSEYQSYLDAAQRFIDSPQSEPFSTRKFSQTIKEHIVPRAKAL